ncbi:ABC transporter ATP-binding protein [Nocardia arthritidis]|nr:ABC transporter ATP-binding protein [Nocardia arthritidis]
MSGPVPGGQPTTAVRVRVMAAGRMAVVAAPGVLAFHLVFTLITGVLPVVGAWLTTLMLDSIVAKAGADVLLWLAVGLGGTSAATAVGPQVTRYLRAQLDREVGLVAQDRLFTAVEGFDGLRRFEDPRFLDRLRLAQQAGGATPGAVIDGALGIARAVLTISGFLGSLLLLSPLITVIVLAAGVPTVVAELRLSRRRARMLWDIGPVERKEIFYSRLLSSVEAAKEVRLFGIGAFLRDRMNAERRTANRAKQLVDRREAGIQAGAALLAAVVASSGLLWAIYQALDGRFSVGRVTLFAAAVAGVQGALISFAGDLARSHQALSIFDNYLAVLSADPDLPVADPPLALPELRSGIEFRDVWFRYADDHPWVLRGVNLRVPRGTSLALVGANGAGKSTLVKLLCRFYDPTRGTILWDGTDISKVDPAALRARICAVFQDYMQYDLTAAENIGVGDLDALRDRPRLTAAADLAGVHRKLAGLPRGYDTLLSRVFFMEADKDNPETGVVLSGGQWQRIALARAFLRDRRELMILDEPSAGLDASAEHRIHCSLRRHRAGRTSLLISHRLAAVREADHIAVLSEGRIVEQGNHAQLMAAGGEYAGLFTTQAAGYRDAIGAEALA